MRAWLVGIALACGLVGASCPPDAAWAKATDQDESITGVTDTLGHVFLIVLENRSYGDILGNPNAPYLNKLANDYAVDEQYRAIAHPSLPNYLALVSGHTFGTRSDCTTCSFDEPNIADEIEKHGMTWKSYQEDLPSPCFLGTQYHGYVIQHNPLLYFDDVRNNPARCQRIVPLDQLNADLDSGSVPDFAWITPNVQHDMHDGSVADADRWLAGFVPRILSSAAWQQNGLLLILWDESSDNRNPDDGGWVPALVISPALPSGYRITQPTSHYTLLRTIEQAWGLGYVGHTADPDVPPLADLVPSAAEMPADAADAPEAD